MARENTVYLYGRLIADPKNRMDKENNPISSRMILQTLRRSYANDEMILQGKIIPDTPIVISRNPELIERMHLSELEKGDFVYVKGTVCTMETRKRYICPRCGHENVKQEGVIVYIDPIYVRKTENDFNEHIKIIEQYLEERIWNLSQFSEDYRPMEVNRIVQILPSCKELRAYLIQQYPGKRFIKENMDDVGNHLSSYKKALEYEMPSYVRTELYRIFINDLNDGSRQAKSFGKKTDITVVLDKWLDKYESIEDIKKIVQTVTVK